ncbi:MAG: DUF402 domain-containing protein [Propionibacteriaceae bacterium]
MTASKSASGGTMRALTSSVAQRPHVDLELLEPYRYPIESPLAERGQHTYLAAGTPICWNYGLTDEMMRVISDDERGLICWQASSSERTCTQRVDGRGNREMPAEERTYGERIVVPDSWHGAGIVRIAPAGAPYSVWFFHHPDGSFAGYYINLELPHLRSLDGRTTYTRDLTLDLWQEPDGTLWLKDFDEVDAYVKAGRYTRAQADEIFRLADQIRFDLLQPRTWPLGADWETWVPSADMDIPARFSID